MKLLTVLMITSLLAACAAASSDEDKVRAAIDSAEKAAEARDVSDVLDLVADNYADSAGMDKAQLQTFLRGYFLSHPKIELLVKVENVEFPVDGLALAVVSITTVEFTDFGSQRLKVEFRRSKGEWQVVRADRVAR